MALVLWTVTAMAETLKSLELATSGQSRHKETLVAREEVTTDCVVEGGNLVLEEMLKAKMFSDIPAWSLDNSENTRLLIAFQETKCPQGPSVCLQEEVWQSCTMGLRAARISEES